MFFFSLMDALLDYLKEYIPKQSLFIYLMSLQ